MKKNEELLQRCFDGDLNDDEMKNLLIEMSKDDILRTQFRALQKLGNKLRSIPSPSVPPMLDERIKSLRSVSNSRMFPEKSALRRVITKRFTLSMPVFAATVLLLLAGSYFAATNFFVLKPETEYVYVLEIEPMIIRSNFIQ